MKGLGLRSKVAIYGGILTLVLTEESFLKD